MNFKINDGQDGIRKGDTAQDAANSFAKSYDRNAVARPSHGDYWAVYVNGRLYQWARSFSVTPS